MYFCYNVAENKFSKFYYPTSGEKGKKSKMLCCSHDFFFLINKKNRFLHLFFRNKLLSHFLKIKFAIISCSFLEINRKNLQNHILNIAIPTGKSVFFAPKLYGQGLPVNFQCSRAHLGSQAVGAEPRHFGVKKWVFRRKNAFHSD